MPASTPKSKVLELRKNSIIVYKKAKSQTDEEFEQFLYDAANDVLARFGISTIVVGVESWDEIMVCHEHEMEKYGWIKRDRVFLLKEQVDLTQYTTEELEEIANMMADQIEDYRRASTSEEEE